MGKKEKKPKSKVRKILEWVFTGVFLTLVAGIAGLRIYQNATGNYSIFGTQYPVVLTDSMEDEYMVGDVLIVESVNEDEISSRIKEGSDISFYWMINGQEYMMTHRVETITYFEDVSQNEGYHWTFVTHGINKHSEQCGGGDCTYQTQTFHENKLIGVVTGKSAFLGFANKAFKSVWTLIILILIPSLYLVVTSVISLIKGLDEAEEVANIEAAKKPTKHNDVLSELSDEDRERLKQEMLEEMLEKASKKK